jgi:hypothetical protein
MALGDLFSDSNEEAGAGYIDKYYRLGERKADRYLKRGYRQAQRGFRPYSKAGRRANRFYADALGLGGQEGIDKSRERFEESPGYDFMMEAGLDALDRRAASRGMLDSGNTSADTIKFAEGTADQEWGDYLDRLDAEAARGMQAQGARAGIRTGLADRLSTNAMDTYRGIGDAYRDYEYSKDASGANILGAVTGGISALTGMMGGGGGGGLASMFGGGSSGGGGAAPMAAPAASPYSRSAPSGGSYSSSLFSLNPVTYRGSGGGGVGPTNANVPGANGPYIY